MGQKATALDGRRGRIADPVVVEQAWQAWRSEIAFADQFVAGAPSLDVTGDDRLNQHGRSASLHRIEASRYLFEPGNVGRPPLLIFVGQVGHARA